MDDAALQQQFESARALARAGSTAQAETLLDGILQARPGHAAAALWRARQLGQRGDLAGAERVLDRACLATPGQEMVAVELAVLRASAGRLPAAIEALRRQVAAAPDSPFAWLVLGQMLADHGQAQQSLLARFEAIRRAHAAGLWSDPATTPPHLVPAVREAIAALRAQRRELFFGVVEPLRSGAADAALARIDRALTGYLKDWDATPPDPMQRPRFFYLPDLPALPYLDPFLHDWAPRLQAAFPVIREEALALIQAQQPLQAFVEVREGDRLDNYLGGAAPSWDAYFFYRHGERFDDHHAQCPRTSAVLESLDLCRIPGQTPELLFSVLAPGTHILPHHGVTNTRLVMHLPLVVPPDCALHLVDRGVHAWREGELVMFDDTYLHESWNRSDRVRIIVLMDCWNPHLSAVEREAVSHVAQAIGAVDVALATGTWA